jgi:hypothetical protein
MTCRHSPGDPSCSSSPAGAARAAAFAEERARTEARKEITRLQDQLRQQTVDAQNYEVEEVARKGPHLAMRVRYPSCAKCAYEGVKVMVFLNTPEMAAPEPHPTPGPGGPGSVAGGDPAQAPTDELALAAAALPADLAEGVRRALRKIIEAERRRA